ncbi:MAG: DUF3616 domain-containing protein [Phycisphaerae bacterium]|nr:DUF3616 domain-containing protein [Phycisphaerae bacterium]
MRSLIPVLFVFMVLAASAPAQPLTVIIVTADSDESERGYTEFLQHLYRGNVDVQIQPDRYDEDLSGKKKLELESADLIIVSRDAGCKDYNADADFWNDVNVPILNHNIKLARRDGHDYWDWLDGDDTATNPFTHIMIADYNDQIFAGLDTSSGAVPMFTEGIKVGHSDQSSAGNGTVIGMSGGNVVIARWLGDEPVYYDGSHYAPGGPRIFFATPKMTYKFFDDATDQAKLMLKNAILSLLPVYRPAADLDYDRDVDFEDFAIFAGYWGDSECLEAAPCAEANFTGDANIADDDLAVFAANWLDGADVTPPEPNVMTWRNEPIATSTTSIYMAATAASDTENGVEYYFQCVSGDGPDSGWQYGSSLEPSTLTPGDEYAYRVKARDTSSRLNETEWSIPVTARTFEMYWQIADASAGAAIDANLFIAAGDELNRLCIYDSNEPNSTPIVDFDLTDFLNIEATHPESDIEGATWFNGRIFWIASHGRNRDGEYWYSRYQFFATTISGAAAEPNITVDGNYSSLIDDLIAYDSIYDLGLADAIGVSAGSIDPLPIPDLAPKIDGLNIEGLCASDDGNSMFIGFRNPRPDVNDVPNALIIRLNNPQEVALNGEAADFDPPILLDLDGLGIRSMEYSPTLGKYLIVAGSHKGGSDEPLQILYSYDMDTGLLTMIDDFPIITPEAMFQFPDTNDIQLLSDDGILMIETPEGPKQNKFLPREQRTFRTQVVTP